MQTPLLPIFSCSESVFVEFRWYVSQQFRCYLVGELRLKTMPYFDGVQNEVKTNVRLGADIWSFYKQNIQIYVCVFVHVLVDKCGLKA